MTYYEYVLIAMVITTVGNCWSASKYWPVVKKFPIRYFCTLVAGLCICFLGKWYMWLLVVSAVSGFGYYGYMWIKHPTWMREAREIQRQAIRTVYPD